MNTDLDFVSSLPDLEASPRWKKLDQKQANTHTLGSDNEEENKENETWTVDEDDVTTKQMKSHMYSSRDEEISKKNEWIIDDDNDDDAIVIVEESTQQSSKKYQFKSKPFLFSQDVFWNRDFAK